MNDPAPLTQAAASAVQLHELFTTYMQAGFSEPQALHIVTALLTESVRTQLQIAAFGGGQL